MNKSTVRNQRKASDKMVKALKTPLNLKKLIAAVAIGGVTLLLAYGIPAVRDLEISLHSWGWLFAPVAFVALIALAFIRRFIGTRVFHVKSSSPIAVLGAPVLDFFVMALLILAGAALFPDYIAYTSGTATVLWTSVCGLVWGTCRLVFARIDASNASR